MRPAAAASFLFYTYPAWVAILAAEDLEQELQEGTRAGRQVAAGGHAGPQGHVEQAPGGQHALQAPVCWVPQGPVR